MRVCALLGSQLLILSETLDLKLLASGTAVHIANIIWGVLANDQ
jgi:hypothetical protein